MTLDESITAAEQADNELMAFYRETGIWPIGKDRPAAMGELGSVDDIRLLAWQYWQKVRQRAATLDEAIEAAAKEIVYPGMVPEDALELTRSAAAQVIRDNIMPIFDRYAKLVEAASRTTKDIDHLLLYASRAPSSRAYRVALQCMMNRITIALADIDKPAEAEKEQA